MRLTGRTLEIDEFGPVDLGDPIDWSLDPFGHPSWRFRLHSLRWLLPLLDESEDLGERATVETILGQWVDANPVDNPPSDFSWSDHSTALRASVLVRAAQRFGAPEWLMEAVREHGAVLAADDFYVKRGNHALDQCIALHEVAAHLKDREWMSIAELRIDALADDSIDQEGVTNEGAIAYQSYNYQRYGAAIAQLERTGRPVSAVLQRRNMMPEMLAFATRPDRHYEQIGDTYLQPPGMARGTIAEFATTQGRSGPKPDRRVAIFGAGYIFGRSGWGEDRPFEKENFYSIRFGSGDAWRFHGHVDHTSVTWHPQGTPLLIEAGFHGYERAPYRYKYVRAPEGHNVVVVREVAGVPTASTHLADSHVDESTESYRLVSDTYPTVVRDRRILVVHDPATLVVLDELTSVRGKVTYDQLWHFHPEVDIHVRERAAVASKHGVSVTVAQVFGGDMRLVRGATEPIQGWVSFSAGHRTPAPTVVTTKFGSRAKFLTVIALGAELSTDVRGSHLYVNVDSVEFRVVLDDLLRITPARRPPAAAGWVDKWRSLYRPRRRGR